MDSIIGREYEIELLKQYINSSKSEFIAVYGRRRVGKTYLIDQLLRKDFAFSLTGIIDGKKDAQMAALKDAFDFYGVNPQKQPQNWMEAFTELRKFLQPKVDGGQKCIMFIDELPCLDYKGSSAWTPSPAKPNPTNFPYSQSSSPRKVWQTVCTQNQ